MFPCFKDVDNKNQNLKTFDVGLLFLWFPVSLNVLPCSVVLSPALNLSETPYPHILSNFLRGNPSFPYPDCGSLHRDMLSIYFFPESPNNLPSIYQSIFPPITLGLTCIVWSLYHIPYLSYPIDMMEKSSLVCVLLCFINTCVWRSKVILVLFLRYCLPCSVEKWSFARLEPRNFQKISFYNGTLAFQKELWVKSFLCKLPVALTGQQASRIHYSYLPPPRPQVLGLQVCITNPPISGENAGAQTQSSCL